MTGTTTLDRGHLLCSSTLLGHALEVASDEADRKPGATPVWVGLRRSSAGDTWQVWVFEFGERPEPGEVIAWGFEHWRVTEHEL